MERRRAMKLKPENVLLRPFVEEIADAQRMTAGKDVTINVDIDSSMCVNADRTHLANVINNLIDNAVKYSGDVVMITVSGGSDGMSQTRVSAFRQNRCRIYLTSSTVCLTATGKMCAVME